MGWPLGYSLSPLMHERALAAAGLRGEYKEYPVKPEGVWDWFHREGLQLDGFNVTMPHKPAAANWCAVQGNVKDRVATCMDAVNTVVVAEGKARGHNTDGEGFLLPLRERQMDLSGWSVVLLGAGGTARAIAVALAYQPGIKKLVIWNRHLERAQGAVERANLVRREQGYGSFAEAVSEIDSLPLRECHLLVNATPAGMKGEVELPIDFNQLHSAQVVYDIVYEPRQTSLIRAARGRGCQVVTGDEMLAGQGAASFELWTGVKGMLPVMRKALEEKQVGSGSR